MRKNQFEKYRLLGLNISFYRKSRGLSQSELAELDGEDKKAFLEDLGIKESGLDSLIKASYTLLGLIDIWLLYSNSRKGPEPVKAAEEA